MRGRDLAVGIVLVGAATLALRTTARADHPEPQGAEDFLAIARVLQSPRCQNCHPAGDAPHIGDQGRVHRMNVSRKSPEAGLACGTCHRATNAPFPHGPPGVPGWRMPPREHPMPFEGQSARALCERIKDPSQNGGKSVPALHEHFADDPLVGWAFQPGPGRTTPPLTHKELVDAVDRWIAKGAPCPP
jgi:hypothetical protein